MSNQIRRGRDKPGGTRGCDMEGEYLLCNVPMDEYVARHRRSYRLGAT